MKHDTAFTSGPDNLFENGWKDTDKTGRTRKVARYNELRNDKESNERREKRRCLYDLRTVSSRGDARK